MSGRYVWQQSYWRPVTNDQGKLVPMVVVYGRNVDNPVEVKKFGFAAQRPYFYIPQGEENRLQGLDGVAEVDFTDRLDAFGRHVYRVYTRLPSDVPKMRDLFTFTCEADIVFDMRMLIDRGIMYGFDDDMRPIDVPLLDPRICFLDIETGNPIDIMPSPDEAIYPVRMIQCKDSYTKEKAIFTLGGRKVREYQYVCSSEADMFAKWIAWIRKHDFDIVTGWYTSGFDFPYLINRAARLHIDVRGLGRPGKLDPTPDRWQGRTPVDMLSFYKTWKSPSGQLPTYDLKYVVKLETTERYEQSKKDFAKGKRKDLAPEPFSYTDYGDQIQTLVDKDDWETLVQYGENDVDALDYIAECTRLFRFYEALRKVSGIKFEDTSKRSKIIEYLLMHRGIKPIPTRRYDAKHVDIQGAYVHQPTAGIKEYVGVTDVNTMYPIIILAHNISPDVDGMIPKIIVELMEVREALRRKRREGKADESDKTAEVGAKFTVNAVYGYLGFEGARLFRPELAAKVTEEGRKINEKMRNYIMSLGYDVIYGDSVAPTTPVLVKRDNQVNIIPIDHVVIGDETWVGKWVRVNNVIRKPVAKDIYMVGTRVGNIVCTQDHSLIQNGERISPTELDIGSNIDIVQYPDINVDSGITEDVAWIIGLFLAEGSRFNERQFVINNQDIDLLEECVARISNECGECPKISNFMESSNCCRISYIPTEIAKYLKECYVRNTWHKGSKKPYETTGYKIIPPFILNAPLNILSAFFDGYYAGDGDKTDPAMRIDSKNECLALGLLYISHRLGLRTRVQIHKKSLSWGLRFPNGPARTRANEVTNLIDVSDRLWFNHVVDLEIDDDSHLFASGRILLHNTDSVMCGPIRTVEEGLELQNKLNEFLLQWAVSLNVPAKYAPQLKLEKIFRRMIFKMRIGREGAAKKRYAGTIMWDEDHGAVPEDKQTIKYVGLEVKRSDTSEFVRKLMEQFYEETLIRADPKKAVGIVKRAYFDMLAGRVDTTAIAVPKGVHSDRESPYTRGMDVGRRLFNIAFRQDKKPKLLYINGCVGGNSLGFVPKELCIDDDITDDQIRRAVTVDFATIAAKTIQRKFESLFASVGESWDEHINGQTGISKWFG